MKGIFTKALALTLLIPAASLVAMENVVAAPAVQSQGFWSSMRTTAQSAGTSIVDNTKAAGRYVGNKVAAGYNASKDFGARQIQAFKDADAKGRTIMAAKGLAGLAVVGAAGYGLYRAYRYFRPALEVDASGKNAAATAQELVAAKEFLVKLKETATAQNADRSNVKPAQLTSIVKFDVTESYLNEKAVGRAFVGKEEREFTSRVYAFEKYIPGMRKTALNVFNTKTLNFFATFIKMFDSELSQKEQNQTAITLYYKELMEACDVMIETVDVAIAKAASLAEAAKAASEAEKAKAPAPVVPGVPAVTSTASTSTPAASTALATVPAASTKAVATPAEQEGRIAKAKAFASNNWKTSAAILAALGTTAAAYKYGIAPRLAASAA